MLYIQLKRLTAMCLAATALLAGVAYADDVASSAQVATVSGAAAIARTEQADMLPAVVIVDAHPLRGDAEPRSAAPITLGTQYRLSQRLTLGGWLQPRSVVTETASEPARYAFGLRLAL